jgi:hypothetical protein
LRPSIAHHVDWPPQHVGKVMVDASALRPALEGAMQGQFDRADHLRKQAEKYNDLAKFARPAYLGGFYRRVAVRYLIMAEDVSRSRRGNDQAPNRI